MVRHLNDTLIRKVFLLFICVVAGGLLLSPVNAAVSADFDISDIHGMPGTIFPVGDSLILTGVDSTAIAWNWTIDGVEASTARSWTTGSFDTAGTYTIALTAVGSDTSVDTVRKTITIQPKDGTIVANFSYTVDYEQFPPKITLFDQSETDGESIVSWYWNVDGTPIPDTQLPEFTLSGDTTLNISMLIVTPGQMDLMNKTIQINEPRGLSGADFAYVLEYGTAPFTVYFIPTGIGSDWTCSWEFGDGESSSEWDPRHTYEPRPDSSEFPADTYTVVLTATKGGEEKIITREIEVHPQEVPTAQWAWSIPDAAAAPDVVAGQEIQFLDWSGGWADSWQWDFGDGQTSSLRSPKHIYTTPGEYNVTLRASNIRGEDRAFSSYIMIGGSFYVEGFADPTDVSIGEEVYFEAQAHVFVNQKEVEDSNSRVASWLWDFGDGSTSTEKDPVHAYTWPSCDEIPYQAMVTATLYDGTTAVSGPIPITVGPSPYAEFYWDPISTEDSSAHYGYKFMSKMCTAGSLKWDFNDGFGSEEENPTHIFREPGVYNVTLRVWENADKTGAEYLAWGTLIVTQSGNPVSGSSNAGLPGTLKKSIDGIEQVPLVADFEADKWVINASEAIQFTDLTTGWPSSWTWDFGDGEKSNLQSPNHTYKYPGVYNVSLEVSNINGQIAESDKPYGYVVVLNPKPVIHASYTPSGEDFDFPLQVSFNAYATVGDKSVEESDKLVREWEWFITDSYEDSYATNYNWLFSSLEQNPVYTFERPGIYNVEVYCELIDGSWNGTIVDPIYVGPRPYANFYWDYLTEVDSCCYLVKFTDSSVGAVSWNWDFGDGAISTEQFPTHRFKEADTTYNVTLTVTDVNGDANTVSYDVPTGNGYKKPDPILVADFSMSPSGGVAPLTVAFTDTSKGSPVSWSWNFGDGSSSSDQDASHTFLSAGTYTVTLTVTNKSGATAEKAATLEVGKYQVIADFNYQQVDEKTFVFMDASTNAISWSWTFGDGTTYVGKYPPVHKFPFTNRYYYVTLTVADGSGNTDSKTQGIFTGYL